MLHRLLVITAIAILASALGCGGSPGGIGPGVATYRITPVNKVLSPGETQSFRARSEYAFTAVQWDMVQGPGAGTLEPYTSQGNFYVRYTAPASPGNYTLRATFTTSGPGSGIGFASIVVQ